MNFLKFPFNARCWKPLFRPRHLVTPGLEMGQRMTHAQKPASHTHWIHLSPDEGDISAIRSIFLRWLPPELIQVILDFVDDWPTLIYSKNDYFDGDAITGDFVGDPDDGHVVNWCYLMTPPLETNGRKVTKIEFVTQSHDQGWASFAEYDTYRQSNTWFEAGIFRSSSFETPMLGWVDLVQTNGPVNIGALSSATPGSGPGWYEEMVNPSNNSGRWRIQRNLTASREVRQHNVVWRLDDVYNDGSEEDLKTGAGRGQAFLEQLEDGDRIAVFSRAKQALWRNHVQSVDVLVTYKA